MLIYTDKTEFDIPSQFDKDIIKQILEGRVITSLTEHEYVTKICFIKPNVVMIYSIDNSDDDYIYEDILDIDMQLYTKLDRKKKLSNLNKL
jgi:hypothetical protein